MRAVFRDSAFEGLGAVFIADALVSFISPAPVVLHGPVILKEVLEVSVASVHKAGFSV